MPDNHYNYQGKELFDKGEKIVRSKMYQDSKGNIKWPSNDGFNTEYLIDNDNYKVKVKLPKGKKLVRYGNKSGRMTADYGTSYEQIALPYKKESMEYHEYILLQDIDANCPTDMGYVAPAFDSSGGVIQYKHDKSISDMLDVGILEETDEWMRKLRK